MGGVQVALIIALRVAQKRHLQWPLTLMAVMSASLLAAGVLRHYWDIYIHRTVRGISFLFVGIDAAGDVFSLVSVIFQHELDVLGMVIYATELVLWIGVFACGCYYNLLPWVQKTVKQKKEKENVNNTAPVPVTLVLHDLPSSTSVFRTPSGEFDMVRRGRGNLQAGDEGVGPSS